MSLQNELDTKRTMLDAFGEYDHSIKNQSDDALKEYEE